MGLRLRFLQLRGESGEDLLLRGGDLDAEDEDEDEEIDFRRLSVAFPRGERDCLATLRRLVRRESRSLSLSEEEKSDELSLLLLLDSDDEMSYFLFFFRL